MKKLSKILVIVLTLAMLLGVVVISASAADADVTYEVNGNATTTDASGNALTLKTAIEMANADTTVGDVTITLGANVSANGISYYVNRPTEYGKVIVNLNGHSITRSAAGPAAEVFDLDHVGAGTTAAADGAAMLDVAYITINVEGDEDNGKTVKYYLKGISFTGYEKGKDETPTAITAVEAGKEYVATSAVTGTKVAQATRYSALFELGMDSDLVVNGSGTITVTKNGATFYIPKGATSTVEGNNFDSVRGCNSILNGFVYANGGKMSFDGIKLESGASDSGYLLVQANDAELNFKNSTIYSYTGYGAHYGVLRTVGNNANKAADGYHVEFDNCLIYSFGTTFSGPSAASDSIYGQALGTASADRRYTSFDNRIFGESYVNTSVRAENCNFVNEAYTTSSSAASRRANDRMSLVYRGGYDIDFIDSNFACSQLLLRATSLYKNKSEIVFDGCYVELSGRGIICNGMNFIFNESSTINTTYVYDTEIRLGKAIAEKGYKNPNGSAISMSTVFTKGIVLGDGTVFDSHIAITTAGLPSGYNVALNANGDYFVVEADKYITVDGKTTGNDKIADPISTLSAGWISNAGVITAKRDNNNRVSPLNKADMGVLAGFTVMQGVFSVEKEANGNEYFCYDPTVVTFNDGLIIADPTKPSGTYYPADANGTVTWTVGETTYTYNQVEAVTKASADDKLKLKATGAWDIDNDGNIEYVDTDGDGKPNLTNVRPQKELAGNTTDMPYCNVIIPEKYTTIYDAISPMIGNLGYLNYTDFEYVVYSFDYMAGKDSAFVPFNFGLQARKSNGDDYNSAMAIAADGTVTIGGKNQYVGVLDPAKWNTITVIGQVVKVAEDKVATNGEYDLWGYYFVNGKLLGKVLADKSAAADRLQNLRGSHNTTIPANAKFCLDNVISDVYTTEPDFADFSKLLSGEKDLDAWTDFKKAHDASYCDTRADVAEVVIPQPFERDLVGLHASDNLSVWGESDKNVYFGYTSFDDAIASDIGGNIKLLVDTEKAQIEEPAVIDANGKKFTYFSKTQKATVNDGIVTFAPAGKEDIVTVTVNYNDGGDIVTDTFARGSYYWLDDDRVVIYKEGELNLETGKIATTTVNGEKPTPGTAFLLDKDQNTFAVELNIIEEYAWMIFDDESKLVYKGADFASLLSRVKAIENAIFDPFANDTEGALGADVDIATKKPLSSYAYAEALSTKSYTIKFYMDLEATETLYFYNLATDDNKKVTIDLNGRTITTGSGSLAHARSTYLVWEYNADGAVVMVHGSSLDGKFQNIGKDMKDVNNSLTTVYNSDLAVSIISSKAGASLVVGGGAKDQLRAPISGATQQDFKIVGSKMSHGATNDNGEWKAYPFATVTLGTPISEGAIGHDENAINVIAEALVDGRQYTVSNYVYNVNAIADVYGVYATGGYFTIRNSTIVYEGSLAMLYANKNPKEIVIDKCNLISKKAVKLFDSVGMAANESKTSYIANSNIINMYLAANVADYKAAAANTIAATVITAGCTYTLPYDAQKANTIILASDRKSATVPYTANVLFGETVTVNGIRYVLTYKVVTDADKITVTFNDKNGVKLADLTYAVGGIASYNATATNDKISNKQYSYAGTEKLTESVTLVATDKIVPAFSLSHNLSLDSNLYHNIKLPRFVNDKSVLDFIIEIKIGDTVVYGEGVNLLGVNNGGDEAAGTTDDLLYTIIEVKSNQIADSYDIMIKFKDESEVEHTSSISTSILAYLEYGLANYEENVERDLYVSLIHYGYASYNYFKNSTEAGKAALAELAAAYPETVVIPEGDKNASGDFFDVEFVLDGALVYRFYFEEFENLNACEYTAYYTKLGADKVTALDLELHFDGEKYYVDVALNAYEFAQDVTVKVTLNGDDGADTIAEATYTVADYYAEIADGNNAALKALIKAVYGYATKANAYKLSTLK